MNQHRQLYAELMDAARRYVSSQFAGVDLSTSPEDSIRSAVEKLYLGGWQDFEADFVRTMQRIEPERKAEPWSPLKVRIKFNRLATGYRCARRLGPYDEVKSFTITDTSMKFVIERATLDPKSRRDKITARTLELHAFSREADTHLWTHEMVDVTTEVNEEVVRYGGIMTPERYESMMDQYETCYRPGTEKTPLPGWVARAELSWKQAHADEAFQEVEKSTKS